MTPVRAVPIIAVMRRLALCGVLLVATTACFPPATAPEPTPTVGPTAAASEAPTFPVRPLLYLHGESIRHPGASANADETLTFRLEFGTAMDVPSVVAAIRARLPEAERFESFSQGALVVFDVPAGRGPLTIDPRGARSLPAPFVGTGVVSGDPWTIQRPETILELFRPSDLAAGSSLPAETYSFPFAANGSIPRFDRSGGTVLLYLAFSRHLAYVDLATGRRMALPPRLSGIGTSGAAMQWLPDGRFLTLGTHETVIAGPRGEDMRTLPTLPPGQFGTVSPDGTHIAVWSYTENTAAVQDLETGEFTPLGGDYLRCSAHFCALPQWSPDGRVVAIGSCGEDMAGTARTVFVDSRSGAPLRALEGRSVTAWLGDGTMLAQSWSSTEGYMRGPDRALALLDGSGRVLRTIESPMPLAISPDGRWLVDAGLDPNQPTRRLIDLRSGAIHGVSIGEGHPTFTPSGLIAVVR